MQMGARVTTERIEGDRAPSRKTRPYGGSQAKAVGWIPAPILSFLIEAGGMLHLFGQVVGVVVRHPKSMVHPTLDYSFVTLKRCWLPVVISLGGFIVFLSVAALVFLNQLGALALFPPVIFRVTIESFTVWAVALVLAGIVGASLTSELGARRVRDELDAMRVMGIDPIRELVAPRMLSAILLTTLMAFPAVAISLYATQFSAAYYAAQNMSEFQAYAFDNMVPLELVLVVVNCLLAGLVIGVVCAYKGMNAGGGSEGLGKAVNQAVVISFVALWIYQTLYTGITQGIFDLGRFR
jgi:phospholipid/cholesterol/gamma-HCH transport system permease protein